MYDTLDTKGGNTMYVRLLLCVSILSTLSAMDYKHRAWVTKRVYTVGEGQDFYTSSYWFHKIENRRDSVETLWMFALSESYLFPKTKLDLFCGHVPVGFTRSIEPNGETFTSQDGKWRVIVDTSTIEREKFYTIMSQCKPDVIIERRNNMCRRMLAALCCCKKRVP
jgi:hypothetical protein